MEQEYSTSIFGKILYGIFAMCLCGVTIYVAIINYKGNNSILILPIIGTLGSTLIVLNLYKRKLVLTDDSISYTNLWGSKKLMINNIRGYRSTKNAYYIYPIDNSYPKISLYDSLSIGDGDALIEWLFKHLKDVDRVAFENDKQAIFSNAAIGKDPEQREDRYENAVIYAIAYNIAGFVLFMLSFMLNIQHWILTGFLLLFPIAGICLMFYTKGIIRFFARLEGSAYRSLYPGIAICEVCLLSRASLNGTLQNYSNLWLSIIIASIIFFIAALAVIVKWAKSAILSQLFFILIFAVCYGFGSVLIIA